jgi:hypothetical protein
MGLRLGGLRCWFGRIGGVGVGAVWPVLCRRERLFVLTTAGPLDLAIGFSLIVFDEMLLPGETEEINSLTFF